MKKQDKKMTSWQAMKQLLPIIGRYRLLLFISIILAAVLRLASAYVPIIFAGPLTRLSALAKLTFQLLARTWSRF